MGDIFLYTQQNTLEPKLLITAAAPQNISTVRYMIGLLSNVKFTTYIWFFNENEE